MNPGSPPQALVDNGFNQQRGRRLQRLSQEEAELDFKDDVSSSNGVDGASSQNRAEAAAKVLRIANMFKAAEEKARAEEQAAREQMSSSSSSHTSSSGETDENSSQSSSNSSSREHTSKDSNKGEEANAKPTLAFDIYDYLEAVQGVLWGCEVFDGSVHHNSASPGHSENGSGNRTGSGSKGEERNNPEKDIMGEEHGDDDAFFLSPILKQLSLPNGLRAATESELAHAAKAGLWAKKTYMLKQQHAETQFEGEARGDSWSSSSSSSNNERRKHRAWSPLDELCCRCVLNICIYVFRRKVVEKWDPAVCLCSEKWLCTISTPYSGSLSHILVSFMSFPILMQVC